jgi:hypothetical protein
MTFDTRLIPNYIAALAIIGVFLWATGYSLVNAEHLLSIVSTNDPKQNLVLGGIVATLFTTLMFILKEVTSYLFRKNPSQDTPDDTSG